MKVSVIIPVYKAEKDIARCCHALFGQTLDCIEYIFVDDCTSDGSVTIIEKTLEEYPQRKPFVKIFHQQKNSGVSACRQLGLDNATGDYIIHCDSDDWADTDMYEQLYKTALTEGAEVVYCDYRVEYGDHVADVVFPDAYIKRPSFNINPIEGAVWNKLISKALINRCGARFYEGINLGEDFGFVTLCRAISKKNTVVHKSMYHYNQQNFNSITHNYTKERFLQVVRLAERVDADFKVNGLAQDYVNELNYLKFQAKSFFLIYNSVLDIKLWRNTFPECSKHSMEYTYPIYAKMAGWLIAHDLAPLAWCLLKIKTLITKH
jgi:glycosyltransferase involved in cell wall biosynthesis